MSVIIRLQNLPLTASSLDIRNFFHGLSIPDGGVHIVGGPEGDAFIAFSTDEDARQAMRLAGQHLKDSRVNLHLSSRNEMYKVIEQARLTAIGSHQSASLSSSSPSSMSNNNTPSLNSLASHHQGHTTLPSHNVVTPNSHSHQHHHVSSSNTAGSTSMSPTSPRMTANDYLQGFSSVSSSSSSTNNSNLPATDLSSHPALLFSTMSAIPSTLGGNANTFLSQVTSQPFPGVVPSNNAQANQNTTAGLPFGGNTTNNSTTAAPQSSTFAGNPFLIPPPTMPLQAFSQGLLSGAAGAHPNPLGGTGASSGLGLGLAPTSAAAAAAALGIPTNVLSTMSSLPGQGSGVINPFSSPPPRAGFMSNGSGGVSSGLTSIGGGAFAFSNTINGPPPTRPNFAPRMQNSFGSGSMMMGAMNSRDSQNNRPNLGPGHGPRAPFGAMGSNLGNRVDRFQAGGLPSRMEMNNVREVREKRSRSRSRERIRDPMSRRRRSRSRERDRGGVDRERRRRRSKSRSKSRSRSRERPGISKPTRRDSRDKREERRRSDSSPEKSSQDSPRRSRKEHEPSPVPSSTNTTTEEWPGAKLLGVSNDASYREIKEFIRVEVMGGSDGVVRFYDEGIAYLKLENPSDFPRVYRSNGRKMRGSTVTIEGITMETWTQEYKLNKTRIERDIDRDREERDRDRGRDERPRDRDREKSDYHKSQSTHHRSSRFSNASSQSRCIAIRGLAPTITRQEVISRYFQDIPCEDVVLIAAPTPTNRNSVTAFVQLASAEIAQTVIDSIARFPISPTLVVETCDVEDLQRAKARTSGSVPGGGRDRDSRSQSGLTQDAKSIFELDLGLDDETTTVILKGAPPSISERDVFDFFSDIGLAPMNVKIMYDSDGQCSGQVICEFQDNNKAKRATTKDGMLFGRGQISVSLLPSRMPRQNSGDFGQQNSFNRNPRPGLLGPAPPRGTGGLSAARYPNPSSSPNIFEQALQQQSAPVRPPMGSGGRGRGQSGERMNRFSNSRNDFRSNGFGRGRGGFAPKQEDNVTMSDDDMALFNRKGCVLGLENIPYKASMDDILQYLEDILKIRVAPDRIIRRYDDNAKATGDARVAFDTVMEAKLACERLNGTYMWKRPISAIVID